MARFSFRLQKLLRLRERAEQDAALALGRLESELALARQELERSAALRRALLERRDRLQQGRVEPLRLGENRYQLLVLERADVLARQRLAAQEQGVRAARAVLQERSRERRLLEKLEERRRAEWELEEARRERRELDARPTPRHGMTIAMPSPIADRR
ncbi:MAG: flagellar export protein FliJ [Candidatus Latescibacteria bacterium]|nr:flagellar export protein FliJ [Candidatus Latescibacterota bacterium]